MTTIAHTLITQKVEDFVAILTINHPPANALTPDLLRELESTMDDLAENERVKALVLTGAGRFFIAGADIRVLAGIASSQEGQKMALDGQAIFNKIERSTKPVIAAINGACFGGGLELAMCCHIRLAANEARLGQPEINLGIIPGFGGTQRLPRLIGSSKATELVLTGESISAEEARTLGLVSQVMPSGDLMRQAIGLARRIASKGQLAVQAALQAIRQGTEIGLREGLTLEANLFGALCESADKTEGLAAFLEKRQPHFQDL
ncbi:MAG: crotonase [Nitrospirales bacterium]|nr:MAG: crotonase [Nitrospirales bacterium]